MVSAPHALDIPLGENASPAFAPGRLLGKLEYAGEVEGDADEGCRGSSELPATSKPLAASEVSKGFFSELN